MLAKYGTGLCCAQKRKAKFDVQTSLEERNLTFSHHIQYFGSQVTIGNLIIVSLDVT
jgi:hypothetical protein